MPTRALLAALLLLPPAAGAATVSADYTGYAHSMAALKLTASLALDGDAYDMHLAFRTVGMIGFLAPNRSDNHAQGRFDTITPRPLVFTSNGTLRGQVRRTALDYTGATPHVRDLWPPAQPERDPVPATLLPGTVDTLSAIAALIHQVATTGHCDGTLTVFDGRRVSTLTAHTTGPETLPPTGRSPFSGPTLRCDFDGAEQAGFLHGESVASQKRPRHGTAWIATLSPGALPIAVKVVFEHHALGQTTLYYDPGRKGK